MPCDWTRYPANWRSEIRPRILEREGHRCKFCGIANCSDLPARCCKEPIFDERGKCCSCGKRRPRVVLTIAHIDHDTNNNANGNLAALCQRCHLDHDKHQHAQNARATRERKAGQLPLAL